MTKSALKTRTLGAFYSFLVLLASLSMCLATPHSTTISNAAQNEAVSIEYFEEIPYLRWSKHPNASDYRLTVNGAEIFMSSGGATYIPIADLLLTGGEYDFAVYAVVEEVNVLLGTCSYAHYSHLQPADGLTLSLGRLGWNSVKNADGYRIYVNGIKVGNVAECRFDLSDIIATSNEVAVCVQPYSNNKYLLSPSPTIINTVYFSDFMSASVPLYIWSVDNSVYVSVSIGEYDSAQIVVLNQNGAVVTSAELCGSYCTLNLEKGTYSVKATIARGAINVYGSADFEVLGGIDE